MDKESTAPGTNITLDDKNQKQQPLPKQKTQLKSICGLEDREMVIFKKGKAWQG